MLLPLLLLTCAVTGLATHEMRRLGPLSDVTDNNMSPSVVNHRSHSNNAQRTEAGS